MMKHLLAISMVVGLCGLFGCRSKDLPAPLPPKVYGSASCDFDQVKWYGVVEPIEHISNGTTDNFLQIFKSSTGQYIHFNNFNFELGKFPVNDSMPAINYLKLVNAYYSAASSDAIEFFYEPLRLDSIDNYLEITVLDETTVQGNFQCVFAKKSVAQIDSIGAIPVDTIFILNGKFTTPRSQ